MGRNIVVVACARSGTKYTSKVLEAFGFRCGHEDVYGPTFTPERGTNPFKGSSYDMDVSWLAAPHLYSIGRYADVYHQTRHPLKTVASLLGLGLFNEKHNKLWSRPALKRMPPVDNMTELQKCICYYVVWNRLISRYAENRFKVEDLTTTPEDVLSMMDLPIRMNPILPATNLNSRTKGPQIEWGDVTGLFAKPFLAMSEEYGYG